MISTGRRTAYERGRFGRWAGPERAPPSGVSSMSWPEMRVPRRRSMRAGGQVGGQLDDRVVGADVDVPEVLSAEAAFVGDGADDLAGLDLLPLADGDPVGRERAAGAATRSSAAGGRDARRAADDRRSRPGPLGRPARCGHRASGRRGRRCGVPDAPARGRAASARRPAAPRRALRRHRPRARCAR